LSRDAIIGIDLRIKVRKSDTLSFISTVNGKDICYIFFAKISNIRILYIRKWYNIIWTLGDILYRIPWQTVLMMMSDSWKTQKKKRPQTQELTRQEEVDAFMTGVKGYNG
jgi:hypothetical protein